MSRGFREFLRQLEDASSWRVCRRPSMPV